MSNTGIKKILFAVISVLLVAAVVAVSFAIWDTKTATNSFSATGGEKITVTLANNNTTFNSRLVPDGVRPTGTDASALYVYAKFQPTMTSKDQNKNAVLRWKFSKIEINGVSQLDNNKDLASTSLLDCWVHTTSTFDRPSDAIAPKTGTLTSGQDYYFVVKFNVFKYKTYTYNSKVYTFYSDGTYKEGTGTLAQLTSTVLTNLGITSDTLSNGLSLYANAPYQSENIDTSKYDAYSGKAINTEITIYADSKS